MHRRSREDRIEELATSISDGVEVDWNDAEISTSDEEELAWLRGLRLVHDVAQYHRDHGGGSGAAATKPSAEETLGVWGHLELLEKVGKGGFGEVYRAWDPRLDREVALKLLRPSASKGGKLVSSILEEGRMLARVHHPNVATVYGAEQHDGQVGIWMEFIHGRTLVELVRHQGPFGAREAIMIGLDVCGALATVHKAGLAHGDIKSQNILREEGGRIVLLDFNSGQELLEGESSAEDKITGTPLYMPPEAFRGHTSSVRGDIYSVGVLLYHLVSGSYPVQAQSLTGLRAAHKRREVSLLRDVRPDLPESFVQAVERALAEDPQERFDSAGQMQQALAKSLGIEGGGPAQEPAVTEETSPAPAQHAEVVRAPRKRRLLLALAGALTLLAAVFIGSNLGSWRQRLPGGAAPAQIASVAVLPFTNLSGDPEQEFFADGMTDVLIANLAKIGALERVSSRSTVMRYKKTHKSLPEIARELRVEAVVEGSVVLSGDRLRITAMLIDGPTERTLWSESYERDLRDVLALQGDLARAIAGGIQLSLSPEEEARLASAHPVNREAYKLYIKGRYQIGTSTPDGFKRAIESFEQATRIAPDFALAYAGLANAYATGALFTYLPHQQAYPKAREFANRALALDENLPEAHGALAAIRRDFDWDFSGAEESYRRAVELNPSGTTSIMDYGDFLIMMGRFDEGLAHAERALRLDPVSLFGNLNLGWSYHGARRFDDSIAQLKKTLELEPFFAAYMELGWNYARKGMFPPRPWPRLTQRDAL